jgi:hypothetical protein
MLRGRTLIRTAAVLALLLWASPALAQSSLGASCTYGTTGATGVPDKTGNNVYCNGNTSTITYPAYQFGSTSNSCSSSNAGQMQWTGSLFEDCNGTAWSTVFDGSSDPLSALTASTTADTFDNAAYAQTWTWNSLAGNTALALTTTDLTSGTILEVENTGGNNSTGYAGYFENITTGAGYALYGLTTGSNNSGYGVYGIDNSASGYGGYFKNTSTGYALYASGNVSVTGLVQVGSSTATCTSALAGATRYDSTTGGLDICNGTSWITEPTNQSGYNPTAPSGSGYFVMSGTQWSGNLGGRTGADSKCYTELTSTNTSWKGYSTASSAGYLTTANIHALLCDQSTCTNLMPLTTYNFAVANNSSAGGATFTTDSNGNGPNDNANWSAANYFSGAYTYWIGMAGASSTTEWTGVPISTSNSAYSCTSWASASSGNDGATASSSNTNYNRWDGSQIACTNTYNLICFVNP